MKMELVLDKKVIDMGFSSPLQNIMITKRMGAHKIITSKELLDIWEANAKNTNYYKLYQGWLMSRVGQKPLFEVVDCSKELGNVISDNEEEKIVLATAKSSNDKIVVGNYSCNVISNNKEIVFIKPEIFNRDKQQIIKSTDLENLLLHKKFEKIFDIYETPITIDVIKNSNASVLAEFLSKFYINSKKVIIQDKYILNNEKNLKEYIIPYINKETEIEFICCWDKHTKSKYDKFINYMGYNAKTKKRNDDLMHSSYIETDKYRIDLKYRLNLFGANNKTNSESVTILRKI